MVTLNKNIKSTPIEEFVKLANDKKIERTSKALEANGIHVLIAENGSEAKRLFFELVPEGAEVFSRSVCDS